MQSISPLGMAEALLEKVAINPTAEPPELTQDGVNRLLEDTNRTLCAPGPRRKEQRPRKRLMPQAIWPRAPAPGAPAPVAGH